MDRRLLVNIGKMPKPPNPKTIIIRKNEYERKEQGKLRTS